MFLTGPILRVEVIYNDAPDRFEVCWCAYPTCAEDLVTTRSIRLSDLEKLVHG